MRFHAEALELATRAGLLDLPAVEECGQYLPDWMIELQASGGGQSWSRRWMSSFLTVYGSCGICLRCSVCWIHGVICPIPAMAF